MDWLLIYGSVAVATMLLMYALEDRASVYVLAFAAACVASSVYGWLVAAYPFGVLEAIWAAVALTALAEESGPGGHEVTTMSNPDALVIAGKSFGSRLMVGTGKYASPEDCVAALDASGTEIVTVAIRRLDLDNPKAQTELDYIDWQRYTILPNTAGSKSAEEAVFTAKLARELTGSNWVKLEVIPDPRYLLPDPIGTLRGGRDAGQGRLRRAALHPRRPGAGASAWKRWAAPR